MAVCYDEATLGALHARGRRGLRRATRCCSTASWRTPSSSTSTCSPTARRAVVARHPAAHRGGGHPLRRLGGGAAAVPGVAGGPGRDARHRPAPGAAARRGRPDERAVRAAATGEVYVLEVNPRASRTVPFIAKAVGVPLVEHRGAGDGREDAWRSSGFTEEPAVPGVFVKAPVFPFRRFPGVDPVLGPEMKSTGEVMGVEPRLRRRLRQGLARRRPPAAARGHGVPLGPRPRQAGACCRWRGASPSSASSWSRPPAPPSTWQRAGPRRCGPVLKVHEGRPHVVDHLINGEIDLVVNTPLGRESHEDDADIRRTALQARHPLHHHPLRRHGRRRRRSRPCSTTA